MVVHSINTLDSFLETIDAAGKQGKIILVDFKAKWCHPCKVIYPFVEALSETYAKRLCVISVDIDEASEISDVNNITNLPTFLFLNGDAKEIKRIVGAEAKELESFCKKITATGSKPVKTNQLEKAHRANHQPKEDDYPEPTATNLGHIPFTEKQLQLNDYFPKTS